MTQDERWMKRALVLARKGIGRTSPNPCVGAIIVRGSKVLGQGWHRAVGKAHAEVEALDDASQRGHDVRGATLYVTLEPCCTWGHTPPCTDALIESGVRRVVVGSQDPNPKHEGKGFVLLKKAGISVVRGVSEAACQQLNQKWNHWIVSRTPWVIAKSAMSLDGKISTTKGESRWITSETARAQGHALRSQVDAILVGIGTVLKDDPELSVRYGKRHPKGLVRIVLDSDARTPLSARILSKEQATWIFVSRDAPASRIKKLLAAGAQVYRTPGSGGQLSLKAVLQRLGKQGITSLVVEGGGRVLGSFFLENRVQQVVWWIAPLIIGGTQSRRSVEGIGFEYWKPAVDLGALKVSKVGPDLRIDAIVRSVS